MFDEDASDDVLVNLDTKSFRDDQCDPRATEAGIAAFELDNGVNEWFGWAFRSQLRSCLCREQLAVLTLHQAVVEF